MGEQQAAEGGARPHTGWAPLFPYRAAPAPRPALRHEILHTPPFLSNASCALFIQPFLKNFPPSRYELETAERLETPRDRTAQRAHRGVCSFPTG